jgi:pantetheine-phosphate adenylyltransferase
MRCGFYPGSFDPPTLGHREIMRRALNIFDRLVVGAGIHPTKAPLFEDGERVEMLRQELESVGAGDRAEVFLFRGLTVDAAREAGAQCIIRGLRDGTDFDYESQMSGMNAQLAPDIETVFVAASPGTSHITATLVRQIASLGGDVSAFVSPGVLYRINQKFQLS